MPAMPPLRSPPVGSLFVRPSSFRRPLVALTLVIAAVLWSPLLVGAQSATSDTSMSPRVVPASLRVRAFGDGVTAGFGVGPSGTELPRSAAMDCRPKWIGDGSATTSGTRCSSNGSNGPGTSADEVSFTADFGAANDVSWAAKVAKELGAIDFANYAVNGSTLASWLNLPKDDSAPAEGVHHDLLERIERDDPDIVLATLGGEALLQQPTGAVRTCARWSDEVSQGQEFTSCLKALLDSQLVKQRLMAISFDVLAHTQNAKLLFATYLPASPRFSVLLPWQQNALALAINAQIVAAVEGVTESGAAWAQRIDIVQAEPTPEICRATPVAGPRFLGPTWLKPQHRCALELNAYITAESNYTPVSLGTIPGSTLQSSLSRPATVLIRARNWA